MGFLPGRWEGAESISMATWISEDAFWLLEPGIRKHCGRYSGYAHYGHTAISREEWAGILIEWGKLADTTGSAVLPIQIAEMRAVPKHVKREFLLDFKRNCAKLSWLIQRLTAILRNELAEHEQITVLGI